MMIGRRELCKVLAAILILVPGHGMEEIKICEFELLVF